MKNKLAIIGLRGFPANFPGSSGIDSYLEAQLPGLSKNNNITLYPRSWAKTEINVYKTVPIPCFQHKYLDTGIYTLLATFFALMNNPDILWYHAPASALFSPIARLFGKKIILTIHGIDWQRQKWNNFFSRNILRLLEIIAINSATEIQVVSHDLQDYILKNYSRSSTYAPPLVNLQPTKKITFLKELGLEKNKYILYLGRLVPEKRIDWLISAYKKINQNQIKLVISGTLENNSYVKSLLKHKNKNIIFTDFVTGNLKIELLSHAYLYVLPSNLEGNSLSLQEAIKCNRIILASNIPIHNSLAKNNNKMHLFCSNNFLDFLKKLEYLI